MYSDMENRMQDQYVASELTFIQMYDEMNQLRKDLAEAQACNTTKPLKQEIKHLLTDLAEREAEIVILRGALDNQCRTLNRHSFTTDLTWKLINTPPSTSYLEQWEKEKYGEPVGYFDQEYTGGPVIIYQVNYNHKDRDGVFPLYARKD